MLSNLNEEQKKAAQLIDGALLILAGAGSGKTKTITTRLAYLISIGIDPSSILTLTFTNKAANEMRERAFNLIEQAKLSSPPLLCTFHKFGLLFLKMYIHKLDRKNNFIIIDSDDKRKIIKSIDKELNTSMISSEISNFKNSLLSPSDVKKELNNKLYIKIANIYEKYQNYLSKSNLVDFDDLLLLTYKILEENEDINDYISDRYQYIMVDEYQDTNELQYKILKKLCKNHNNICVVGDDDQSIYGWRGANIKNILNFKDNFKDVTIVKLENNYRSTENILKLANNLIEHNRNRLGKKLKSVKGKGEEIKLIESNDENEEANKIANRIKKLVDNKESLNDIAILYRINALSRALEEALNKEGIKYKIIGGIKFYERSEIKDLIAYFRVLTNKNDDFSFKRIINKPKRGIGSTTISKLEVSANEHKKSIYSLIEESDANELGKIVGKKNTRTLKYFVASIKDLQDVLKNQRGNFINSFEDIFEYRKSYEHLIDEQDRVANIDEFYGLTKEYLLTNLDNSLEDFLNELSLESDQDEISNSCVSLMSIHAAKGLEYKHLFVIGLEEGFFPLTGDGSDIEEERRLGYVAITRAKDSLTLSFVHSRYYKGKRSQLVKSRFLSECGLVKGGFHIDRANLSEFKKDDLVKHKIFGMGKVEAVKKVGKDYKLKINFGGSKREILSGFVEKI